MTQLAQWCSKFRELLAVAEGLSGRIRALGRAPGAGDPSEELRELAELWSGLVDSSAQLPIVARAAVLKRMVVGGAGQAENAITNTLEDLSRRISQLLDAGVSHPEVRLIRTADFEDSSGRITLLRPPGNLILAAGPIARLPQGHWLLAPSVLPPLQDLYQLDGGPALILGPCSESGSGTIWRRAFYPLTTALNWTRRLAVEQVRHEADERRKKDEEKNREDFESRKDPRYAARQLAQQVAGQQRRIEELEPARGVVPSGAASPIPVLPGSLLERAGQYGKLASDTQRQKGSSSAVVEAAVAAAFEQEKADRGGHE